MSGTPAIAAEDAAASEVLAERELGFWLFLMSDAIVFALLFATYAVMAADHAASGSATLSNLPRSAIETALLLTSSLGFGLANLALAEQRSGPALLWLLSTALLGLGFLALEAYDFQALIARGNGPQLNALLSAYFTLVGTHGLHVAMGLIWIAVMAVQLNMRGPSAEVRSRLARLGLYWHFLDIVWIGIYSVVILPGFLR